MPLVEVIPSATAARAPGWAYVPDTGYDPSKAPIQPAARKRNARIAEPGGGDLTLRQSNALARRLADLDKDNFRDIQIPVPNRQRDGGRAPKGKTAGTRKIILAQKTFANYVVDEEALAVIEQQNPGSKPRAHGANLSRLPSAQVKLETTNVTLRAVDAPLGLPRSERCFPPMSGYAVQEAAEARLLQCVVPSRPSEALLEAIVSAPSLSYGEARAGPPTSGLPQRHFCELCGYWGTIRCVQCGARACGLLCKKAHDEDRCQKYGG